MLGVGGVCNFAILEKVEHAVCLCLHARMCMSVRTGVLCLVFPSHIAAES